METTATIHGTVSVWTMIKNAAYVPAFVLGLSTDAYGILALLMIIDTVTGVMRSGTLHGWRSITSHAAELGLLSKLVLLLIPLTIALVAKGVGLDVHWVATGSLSVLILSEGYSVLGNIQATYTKKDVVEFDAINFLLTRLRDFLEKTIKKPVK